MNKYIKYISMFAGGLLLGGALSACTDKDLALDPSGDNSIYDIAEDEYGLGVTISLSNLNGTRTTLEDIGDKGLQDIEEYVNTDNLYVLFFNLEGYFLFQIDKPVAIPMGQSQYGNDNQWFIKIPVKEINENLIHYIEENPFKIAVLANWTFDSDINQGGDLTNGNWDYFEFHQPLDEEGNLTYDEFGKLKGDHISMLSHAERDNVYTSETIKGGYDHLAYYPEGHDHPHMGPYTEWVWNYHKSIDIADTDIRNEFDVESNKYSNSAHQSGELGDFKMEYNNIWHVWHFSGKDDSNYFYGDTKKAAWLVHNNKARESFEKEYLDKWVGFNEHLYYNKGTTLHWKMSKYENLDFTYGVEAVGEDGNQISESNPMKAVVIRQELINHQNNWELGNPLNLNAYSEDDFFNKKTPRPYIHFMANADGYVRIKYKAVGGAKLYAHVGRNNTPQNNATGYQKDNLTNRYIVNEEGYLVKSENGSKQIADIPFDPKDVYIYMVKDPNYTPSNGESAEPSVTIYGLEYIESRHLYDVDRHGILPSKENPIPMYGIQDFDPIGEYWEPGVLFNLSMFNNAQKEGYSYRHISLLRSLSRVEVRLSKSAFPKKPSHVYLRSLNRSARIMPVDFITPTDIIWNGFNSGNASDVKRLNNYLNAGLVAEYDIMMKTPGVEQEWNNIMQYGPIYIGTNENQGQSDKQKMNEYRKTTAWPFGIWEPQWGWDWNRENGLVDHFDTYKPGQTRAHTGEIVPEYPRILHTRISRSDYARFTEINDGGNYWHYIIYVAEKNITDADNPGNIADRPKICHVEIRFNDGMPKYDENGDPVTDDPENVVDNFDDNGAYRLYFTTGGRANLGSFNFTGRESWDAYEYDRNIAKQHWPIMRNHIYSFKVFGSPNKGMVDLQVAAPDQRWTGWMFY